ncbi:uncharacterized protein LOC144449934 [Glandiceps talaboti]
METSEGISLELWRNIQLLCPTNADSLFQGGGGVSMSTNSFPVSESESAFGVNNSVLSVQECSYLWDEARRTNSVDKLGNYFSLCCQELLSQLEQDTLMDKGKTAILNFLCQYGIIKMKLMSSASISHSIGHRHGDRVDNQHLIGHRHGDMINSLPSTANPIGHHEILQSSQTSEKNPQEYHKTRNRQSLETGGRKNRRTILPPRNVNRQYEDLEVDYNLEEEGTTFEENNCSLPSALQSHGVDRQTHRHSDQGGKELDSDDSATNVTYGERRSDDNTGVEKSTVDKTFVCTVDKRQVNLTSGDGRRKSSSSSTQDDGAIKQHSVKRQTRRTNTTIHWRDGDMDTDGNKVCVSSDSEEVQQRADRRKQVDAEKADARRNTIEGLAGVENSNHPDPEKVNTRRNVTEVVPCTEKSEQVETDISNTDNDVVHKKRKSIHKNIEWLNERTMRSDNAISVPIATVPMANDGDDKGIDVGYGENTGTIDSERCRIKEEERALPACKNEKMKLFDREMAHLQKSLPGSVCVGREEDSVLGSDPGNVEQEVVSQTMLGSHYSGDNDGGNKVKIKVEKDDDMTEGGSVADEGNTQYWAVEQHQIMGSDANGCQGDTEMTLSDPHHNVFVNADREGLSTGNQLMTSTRKFPIMAPSSLPKFPIMGPSSLQNFPIMAPSSLQKFPIMTNPNLQKFPTTAHSSLQNIPGMAHSGLQEFSDMAASNLHKSPASKASKDSLSPEEKKQIAAEKMRRYRAKLRQNEEKWRAYRARDTERKRILRRNKKLSTAEEQEYREKARRQQQRYRERMHRIRQTGDQSDMTMDQSELYANHDYYSNNDLNFYN